MGGRLFNWIPRITSALGSAGCFISVNKDTITNVANVVGKVVKAGATTATPIRQTVDAMKAKVLKAPDAPTPLEKALNDKSTDFLKQLT